MIECNLNRMFSRPWLSLASFFMGGAIFLSVSSSRSETIDDPKKIAAETMHLLHNNCISCHNPEKHKGGLQLTTREGLLKGGDDGAVISESLTKARF